MGLCSLIPWHWLFQQGICLECPFRFPCQLTCLTPQGTPLAGYLSSLQQQPRPPSPSQSFPFRLLAGIQYKGLSGLQLLQPKLRHLSLSGHFFSLFFFFCAAPTNTPTFSPHASLHF